MAAELVSTCPRQYISKIVLGRFLCVDFSPGGCANESREERQGRTAGCRMRRAAL